MKKRWALVMAASMVLTCTACNTDTKKTEAPDTDPATTEATTIEETTVEETTVEETTEAQTEAELETEDMTAEVGAGLVTYFSMTMGNSEEMDYMSAYDDEAGGVYVDYVGEEKKIGTLDLDVLETITAELAKSGLAELNGQSVYEEGEAMASLYVQYEDGSYLTADFSGEIAEEFVAGYETMDKVFQSLTEELPVYVPQPMIMGEVNEDALAAITEVLEASDIENLDSLAISDVPLDENFAYGMGLSKTDGIVNGTSCTTMMMTSAYSFVIATVEDEADIKAVREDFEKSMDWHKWVCVMPSDALIAQKDNMVVCVMGAEDMFQMTADAIEAAGWTEIKTFENPDM